MYIKKICLFGCTADPFTPAHMAMVEAACKIHDIVVIIPTIVDYYRAGKIKWLSDDQKLEVINAFVNKSKFWHKIIVDDHEFQLRTRLSLEELVNRRFYHTLNDMISKYSENGMNEICMMIGSDSYINFGTWYAYDKILNILGDNRLYVVVGRNGMTNESLPTYKFLNENGELQDYHINTFKIDDKFKDMSATKIRAKYSDYKTYLADILD